MPRDASDLRLEGDTHHAKFFFLSSLVGSGEECPVWGDDSCVAGCSNFGFALPVTGDRGEFLSSASDRHPIFELLPPAITATGILASFEQTQRVPTGHPDVCLCDVSGATNK